MVGFSKSFTLSIRFCGDLEWLTMLIFESSTRSERFTANCQDLEFFHFFFHRFWLDLECLNCWFWLEFQNLPHLFLHSFSENCLDLEWPNTLILVGIPKSSTGGVWISNGIAHYRMRRYTDYCEFPHEDIGAFLRCTFTQGLIWNYANSTRSCFSTSRNTQKIVNFLTEIHIFVDFHVKIHAGT